MSVGYNTMSGRVRDSKPVDRGNNPTGRSSCRRSYPPRSYAIDDRRREAVTFISGRGSHSAISGRADPNAGNAILIGQTRDASEQRVLNNRRIIAIEKHA